MRRAHANSCAFEKKPDPLFAANEVAHAAATYPGGSLDGDCGNCFRTVGSSTPFIREKRAYQRYRRLENGREKVWIALRHKGIN